jgi:hypothetical protein
MNTIILALINILVKRPARLTLHQALDRSLAHGYAAVDWSQVEGKGNSWGGGRNA